MSAEMREAFDHVSINFANIPAYLKQFPNWAFYTKKKAPIKVSAVVRGWPTYGWNSSINGASASAGARSNDPNTWAMFEDVHSAYYKYIATADTLAASKIHGPTIALSEELQLVVIDLDDPERSIGDNKRSAVTGLPLTDEERKKLIHAAYITQEEILRCFRGHYIERSASGKGYHIFIIGRLNHTRYRLGFHGSVFSAGQFINMTGDTENLGHTINGEPIICGPLQTAPENLREFEIYYSSADIGLLTVKERDDDPKSYEEGEEFEIDNTKYGRRVDLTDDEVLAKLSKGMQAVYNGGGISGDHSEDTMRLLGDIEKITGDVNQIERLMRRSPRMLNAGIGNDGQDRWRKFFRLFPRHVSKVRASNDNKLAEWESKGTLLTSDRKELMRQNFERITSVNDPGSLAYKDDQARRKLEEQDSEARKQHEEIAARIKTERSTIRLKGRQYTKYSTDAMELLSCGIDPGYLEECVPPTRMGELCYYAYEGMHAPFMKFAIPATFAAMAGIVARKYKFRGDGLNLLIVLLGKTGVGKTQSIDAWHDFSSDLRREQFICERYMDIPVSSKQGFHVKLEERPCFTWVKDECASQLQSIIAPKHGDTAAELLQGFANQIFDLSKATKTYYPSLSRNSERAGEQPIPNLCVSTYWGTTQSNARQFFTKESVQSGITSRMVFINHGKAGGISRGFDEQRMVALPFGDTRNIVLQLMIAADELDAHYTIAKGGKISEDNNPDAIRKHMEEAEQARITLGSKIVAVQIDDQARQLAKNLYQQLDVFIRPIQNEESVFPEYYIALNRLGILSIRFAAVMAVLDNPHQPCINYSHLAWAVGYILQSTCGILSAFDQNDLGIELADAEMTVIKLMKLMVNEPQYVDLGCVPYGALVHRLKQNAPFRQARDPRNECKRCLDDMIEHEMVRCVDRSAVDPGGRPLPGPRPRFLYMNEHPCWLM